MIAIFDKRVFDVVRFITEGDCPNQRWFQCSECWFLLHRNHGFLTQEYSKPQILKF